MTDATEYSLFSSSGSRTFDNLMEFSVDNTNVVSVSGTTGEVTLLDNLHQTVTLTATSLPQSEAVSATVSFACNLDFAAGDVDLGSATGIAVAPTVSGDIGSTFTVAVRLNTDGKKLGAVDLVVEYDETVVAPTTVTTGATWPGGVFNFNLNDPVGVISLGGAPTTGVSSAAYHVATITFEVVSAGTVELFGHTVTMSTFADENANVFAIGSPEASSSSPRSFVAGDLRTSGLARRWISEDVIRSRSRRADDVVTTKCASTAPCDATACGGRRQTGDINGDCIFDVNDVSFLQLYLAEQIFSFSTTRGQAIASSLQAYQEAEMDVDRNGAVNPTDTSVLARVNFRLLRFLRNMTVTPVEADDEGCGLTILAEVLLKGDTADSTDQTRVYFDIAALSTQGGSAFQTAFDSSNATVGTIVTNSKGSGHFGGILLAEAIGDGWYQVTLSTPIELTDIGLSPIIKTYDTLGGSNAV
jgi:hypothetical protein